MFPYFPQRFQHADPPSRGANTIGNLSGNRVVDGYRLAFDKVSTDGSGKCDIERTGNTSDRVYGLLFSIAESEADALDDAEGL